MGKTRWLFKQFYYNLFSLWWGNLIGMSCPFVSLSSILYFFKKRGFDSVLQDVTASEIQVATCLMRPNLYYLIYFFKRLIQVLCTCIISKLWMPETPFCQFRTCFSYFLFNIRAASGSARPSNSCPLRLWILVHILKLPGTYSMAMIF